MPEPGGSNPGRNRSAQNRYALPLAGLAGAGLMLAACLTPALAQSPIATGADSLGGSFSPFGETNYAWLLVRTLLYLGVISLAIYALIRWVGPRLFGWRTPGSGPMVILDRIPLGGSRSVCVLKAAGRYYLLGVSDGQVRLLTELDPDEVCEHYPSASGKTR